MRTVAIATGLVAGLALAYVAWWFLLAWRVEQALPEALGNVAGTGIPVSAHSVQVSGFPYRITVHLERPRVAGPGWSWESAEAQVYAQPWNLDHWVVLVPGTHAWRRDGWPGEARWERGRGSLVLDSSGSPVRASAEATNLTSSDFEGQGIEVHARRLANQLEIAARATGLFFGHEIPALGATVEALLLEVVLRPLPDGDLETWRQAGGVADIRRLQAVWGPLEGTVGGSMSLDGEGRPLGSFTATIKGFEALVTALEEGEWISGVAASLLRGVHRAGAMERAEGSRVLRVPVVLQDGLVSVAGIALVDLPQVVIPGERQ